MRDVQQSWQPQVGSHLHGTEVSRGQWGPPPALGMLSQGSLERPCSSTLARDKVLLQEE